MNSCYAPLCGKLPTAAEPVEAKKEPSHNVKLVEYTSAACKIRPDGNVPAEEICDIIQSTFCHPSLKHQSVCWPCYHGKRAACDDLTRHRSHPDGIRRNLRFSILLWKVSNPSPESLDEHFAIWVTATRCKIICKEILISFWQNILTCVGLTVGIWRGKLLVLHFLTLDFGTLLSCVMHFNQTQSSWNESCAHVNYLKCDLHIAQLATRQTSLTPIWHQPLLNYSLFLESMLLYSFSETQEHKTKSLRFQTEGVLQDSSRSSGHLSSLMWAGLETVLATQRCVVAFTWKYSDFCSSLFMFN